MRDLPRSQVIEGKVVAALVSEEVVGLLAIQAGVVVGQFLPASANLHASE
jgi:hypothetical protein